MLPTNWECRLEELAKLSRIRCRDYVEESLRVFELKNRNGRLPIVAFLGRGRAGKDEACLFLSKFGPWRYTGSVSEAVRPLVAAACDEDEQTVYLTRHSNRKFWRAFCDELRRDDPGFLLKLCLSRNDLIAGIRALPELRAAKSDKFFDLSIFVVNSRVEPDPTLEYGSEECDLVIENESDLASYHDRLANLAKTLLKGDQHLWSRK